MLLNQFVTSKRDTLNHWIATKLSAQYLSIQDGMHLKEVQPQLLRSHSEPLDNPLQRKGLDLGTAYVLNQTTAKKSIVRYSNV